MSEINLPVPSANAPASSDHNADQAEVDSHRDPVNRAAVVAGGAASQPTAASSPLIAPAISLRRSLLRRLAAPLSMLALASGLVAYWLAWQYTEHVVDRTMTDFATAISKQIQVAGLDAPQSVPPLAHAMFSDPVVQLVYRITNGVHEYGGDPALPLRGSHGRVVDQAYVFETYLDGQAVRLAQITVPQAGAPPIVVEVGQRVSRRFRLATEFLVAIMMPLLILLLAGWVIVWRVVNHQLIPLTQLAGSLNRQTSTSLEPVDETLVPVEIRPLTGALNALLDRLKAALDSQRKFIADAAHQLRTPLTAVKLHAEQAASARDPQQVAAAISELRASADRAVRLSNQLLSLARAEPSEQTARFVAVDLAVLAFETGAEWVPRALAAGVDLGFSQASSSGARTNLDSDPDALQSVLMVKANPVLLREVVANLIDNALKYVRPFRSDGHITVSVRRALEHNGESGGEIVVEDNGPGVPEHMHADMFKRFFRGDANVDYDGGAGLGLAIVHDIMKLHGGSIRYQDAPGGGSRFVVYLPLA